MGTVRILIACGSCGAVVGLAVWAGLLATGGALFLTSLVSSAVIIATALTLKQSHLARVTLSHAIAMISGIGMRAVLPMSPYAVALSRSEEHTSELQSLMRTSYALFCCKK